MAGPQAATIPITKAANLPYRLRGACPIITFGFTPLDTALTLAVYNLGAYASCPTGLPEPAAAAPRRLAPGHSLHHHHPGPRPAPLPGPRREAAVRVGHAGRFHRDGADLRAEHALGYHAANPGSYDQVYGQLGAAIVFMMLWLHTTDLVVLLGSR